MRLLWKYAIANTITSICGCVGTLAIMIGGSSCLTGLSIDGVVRLGEFFSSGRPIYQKLMFYGSASSGAGLFLVGTAAIVASVRDKIENENMDQLYEIEQLGDRYQQDLQRKGDQMASTDWQNNPSCLSCKFHNNNRFLPCAVRPNGFIENCPDWQAK